MIAAGTLAAACLSPAASLAQPATSESEPVVEAEEAADAVAPEDDATEAGSSGPPPGVEVMRVRGRGIAALETEVPSSVTQFDAATIEALGAQDISDLSRVTPNVNIVQPGSTQATFFVRGVGLSDFSSNAAGAVTIFQDDVSLNAPAIQTGQLFDVENVEVLRGPQGSGPYRNASAGAIRVRSRRPTGNYSAQLRSSLGRYDTKGEKGARDAWIQDYEGALEVPVVEDLLSSRFAFRFRDAEPYKTNGCGDALPLDQREILQQRIVNPNPPPQRITIGAPFDDPRVSQCGERSFQPGTLSHVPFGLPKYVDDQHNWAARGTFALQPPELDWSFSLNLHGSRLDQDSTLGQAIGTTPLPGAIGTPPIPFAGRQGGGGYVAQEVQAEFDALCNDQDPGGNVQCANRFAAYQIAKKHAEDRPLDELPYRGDYNRVGQTTRDTWGGFLSAEGEVLDDMNLFVLASYDAYERFQEVDSDFTPDRLFETTQEDEAWQMYYELRLDGEFRVQPVTWSVGAYYLHERLYSTPDIFLLAASGLDNLNTHRVFTQTIDGYALWGEFAWDFADDFTLEGGVRWNWERKDFDFRKTGGRLADSNVAVESTETWQTPTGQIILTYHIDESRSAYARYTRGFKVGHFNSLASEVPAETVFQIEPADEEYNDAWEAGLRGTWLDRRLELTTSFFYYRYENYQIFLFTDSADQAEPPVLEIANADRAENYGVELEAVLRPLEGWAPRVISGLRVSGNFGWLHGEYIDFTAPRKVQLGTSTSFVPVDYSGNRLQNAPEYKVSGTAEWTFDLGRFGYLIPRYDVNWTDDVFFDPNEGRGSIAPNQPTLVEYGVGQKAFFLHNVRLAYRTPTGNVEVAGWIRNLEDTVYKSFAFDASQFSNIVLNFPGEPRTIGADLTITF